jgi:hypothetical protein
MLAAIGRHYGWPRHELESLTGEDMRFWLGCIVAMNEARSE